MWAHVSSDVMLTSSWCLQDCAVGRVFVNHSTPNAPIGLLMAKDLDTGEYHRVDDLDYGIRVKNWIFIFFLEVSIIYSTIFVLLIFCQVLTILMYSKLWYVLFNRNLPCSAAPHAYSSLFCGELTIKIDGHSWSASVSIIAIALESL